MAAVADIVLNTAADLTRAQAWLPAPLHVVGSGDGTVDVGWTPDGSTHRYQVRLDADEHRLEWRPVDHDGWPGHLRVVEGGAGASEVELQVEAGAGVAEDDVRAALDRALRGLAAEVEQNFNVS
ncbi:SRPBCC family protein [Saccharothrix coeruleofusca]|uniref:Polyketide cyclase/dehydrase/lipid transport protein n=1 Tax=Saccharothrix coeruleofusca TaxID=33919 RepID=A0A918AY40_9PSEU|nr:SRPBCC family protein [Saccharothrix coeruleofusca]MBP2335854.1 hypothetical protein [Saccharothrix coeruleofusca]GGP87424.1 hypothetical protein GCM10010185_71310 [Saccharothrix coeruleofusca]